VGKRLITQGVKWCIVGREELDDGKFYGSLQGFLLAF
jgi:hypothetical protein